MTKLLAVLVLVSGCSVALQSKPRAEKVASGDCSTSSMYWITDAVVAGAAATAAGVGTTIALSENGHDELGYTMAGVGAMTALVYYASMDNGRKWSRECAAAGGTVAAR